MRSVVQHRLTVSASDMAISFAINKHSTSPEGTSRIRVSRRDLLLGTATAVFAEPLLAAGQVRRIGVIGVGSRQANQNLLAAFHGALAALGWTDEDLMALDRWADERAEQLSSLAAELVRAGVDLLVTIGTPATLAARNTTVTIPIVFVGVGDPVSVGAVRSLARPGGNATGLSLSSVDLIAQRVQLLQELLPGLHRVAVILRDDPRLEQTVLDIRSIANRMGLQLVEFVAPTGSALGLAFRWLKSEPKDALYVASGPLGPAKRAEIIKFAGETHTPAIYCFRIFAVGGGLMSFAVDEMELFRRAAAFADKILNRAAPAEIPVEEPSRFRLAINMKTARALGLAVPQSILGRADEVIE